MKLRVLILILIISSGILLFNSFKGDSQSSDFYMYEYVKDHGDLSLVYKDGKGGLYRNINILKLDLESAGKELVFAMNAGMYQENGTPLGLYIEDCKQLKRLNNVEEAFGNFYLQPNGVFYLKNDGLYVVKQRKDIDGLEEMKYATQSGPMLLIDGEYHLAFNADSKNLNIRNGVGILPNGNPLFVMSKVPVTFYELADFFKSKGCENALYLDGFVSRMYCPKAGVEQLGGNFGVMIQVSR